MKKIVRDGSFCFYFAMPQGKWDLNSPTGD